MKKSIACLAVLLMASATVVAEEVSVEGVKCIMSGGPANAEKTVDYKGAKLFFCCDNCPAAFDADNEKQATKANHQLVATKQFEQKGCPMSGGPVSEGTEVTIAGAKVGFCCNNCKGKVEGAKDDAAKLKLVFNNKSFTKAFKLKDAK